VSLEHIIQDAASKFLEQNQKQVDALSECIAGLQDACDTLSNQLARIEKLLTPKAHCSSEPLGEKFVKEVS